MKIKKIIPLFFLLPSSVFAFRQPQALILEKIRQIKDKKIVVAVIDTGIDEKHPALRDQLWINNQEIPNNGIDDDHNGFVDDIHGWNFVEDNQDLQDHHGHGTHIAGIISGQPQLNNKIKNIALMPLKYYDPQASGFINLTNSLRALRYAIEMKADIINYSGGGMDPHPLERELLKLAEERNILVVAAAGNEYSNSDLKPFYPAGYGLKNIISVTALDFQSRMLATSNFGEKSVDLAAPGKDILSTLPGGRYGRMTGTSQATAVISKWAALLLNTSPHRIKAQEILKKLLKLGQKDEKLIGKTKYQVRLSLDLWPY